MEQLTKYQVVPYIPFEAQCQWSRSDGKIVTQVLTLSDASWLIHRTDFKLHLRPLFQLKEEIEHNGERFVPAVRIGLNKILPHAQRERKIDDIIKRTQLMEYFIVQQLLEMHFDVFGLIDKGLAIPIPSLNS